MPDRLMLAAVMIASYLIGGIPFGYLIARSRGIDIFKAGSGNIGATNVGRVLGRKFGVLVFCLDFAKGALPVLAAAWLSRHVAGLATENRLVEVAAGLSAFLGHLFPVYLRFRGGKGVATGAGVVAVLVPGAALAALVFWIATAAATRFVSLASIVASLALFVWNLTRASDPWAAQNFVVTLFCLVAMALVIGKHHANIGRLARGQESRLHFSNSTLFASKALHLLAVGVWLGSGVFFAAAAVKVFDAFEGLGRPGFERPAWLPLPARFTEEDGTKLAGVAVNPLFALYYPLQAACAVIALGTAAGWKPLKRAGLHRIRVTVLSLACATVAIGWLAARHVGRLRIERYAADPGVANTAKLAFGPWHAASLILNFITLIAVGSALVLATRLPDSPQPADHEGLRNHP